MTEIFSTRGTVLGFWEVGEGSSANTHLVDLFYERHKGYPGMYFVDPNFVYLRTDKVGAWLGQSGCTPTSVKGENPRVWKLRRDTLSR